MARLLGWSSDRIASEIAHCSARWEADLAMLAKGPVRSGTEAALQHSS
jgi:hypothetical protein